MDPWRGLVGGPAATSIETTSRLDGSDGAPGFRHKIPMARAPHGQILVVEDNDETRYLLERILAIKGYAAVTAPDAATAMQCLEHEPPPAAVILDIGLPDVDGDQLLRRMKSNPALADVPVVIYSAHPGKVPDAVATVRKGTDDPDVLLDAIAACLAQPAPARTG